MELTVQEVMKLEQEGKIDRKKPRKILKNKIIAFLEKRQKYMKGKDIEKSLNMGNISNMLGYLVRRGYIDRIYIEGKLGYTKIPLYGPKLK